MSSARNRWQADNQAPAEQLTAALVELAGKALPREAAIAIGGITDPVTRSRVLQAFEAAHGAIPARQLQRDVWALVQSVRAPA